MKNTPAFCCPQTRLILLLIVVITALAASGCTEKTGANEDPVAPWYPSYVTPTVSNLKAYATSISRCSGGILKLTCDWTSPGAVSTITAYVGFVRTIQNPKTEPVGIIASQVASLSRDIRFSFLGQIATTTATTTACVASETEAFYRRFNEPIKVVTKIGTSETAGQWGAEIPFAHEDIASAPLGVHQMIFYMEINHHKTNTHAFELTFVP